MTSTPTNIGVEEYPHQYARTYGLMEALKARGCLAKRVGHDLEVIGRRGQTVTIKCVPRPSDDDRLWFRVGAAGEWVDPADHVPDAAMKIAPMVGVRGDAGTGRA